MSILENKKTTAIVSIVSVVISILVFLIGDGILNNKKPDKEPKQPPANEKTKNNTPKVFSTADEGNNKARYNFPDPYQIYDLEFSIIGIFGTESGIIAEFEVTNLGPERTIIIFADNTSLSDPENRNQFSLLTTNRDQLRASYVKFGSPKSTKYGKVSPFRPDQPMIGQIEFEKAGVARNESFGINLRCWLDDVKEFNISFPQVRQL